MIQQLRQYLLHNLWHGEQKKRDFLRFFGAVPALVSPDTTRPWGTDISHWDGNVRLESTANKGADFVFIKGMDGTITARYFVENRQRAIDAGLINGVYGWLYRNANVSCVAQAQALHALMQKYPVDLPVVIDFEPTKWGGQASNPTYADLRLWATEWLRLGNRKPILYSAAYYMNQYGAMPADLKDMFEGLWVAHYGTLNPTLPYGWSGWLFHQFTSSGDAAVLSPNDVNKLEVDLNYAISTEKLYQLADLVPPIGGVMRYGTVNTAGLNIRTGPGTSYPDVGDLLQGDQVQAVEVLGGWWHLVDARRNGQPVKTSDGRAVSDRLDCWVSGTYILETAAPEPVIVFEPFDLHYTVDGVAKVQRYLPE